MHKCLYYCLMKWQIRHMKPQNSTQSVSVVHWFVKHFYFTWVKGIGRFKDPFVCTENLLSEWMPFCVSSIIPVPVTQGKFDPLTVWGNTYVYVNVIVQKRSPCLIWKGPRLSQTLCAFEEKHCLNAKALLCQTVITLLWYFCNNKHNDNIVFCIGKFLFQKSWSVNVTQTIMSVYPSFNAPFCSWLEVKLKVLYKYAYKKFLCSIHFVNLLLSLGFGSWSGTCQICMPICFPGYKYRSVKTQGT